MFSFVFWVLLCWFIVNVIWMWFVLKNQTYQRVFAWINVCAVVIGFCILWCCPWSKWNRYLVYLVKLDQRSLSLPSILLRIPQAKQLIIINKKAALRINPFNAAFILVNLFCKKFLLQRGWWQFYHERKKDHLECKDGMEHEEDRLKITQ